MAEFCPLCTDQSVQGGLMYKILIVEDDLPMAQAIQKEMKMWGNEAEYVQDFQNVLTTFTAYDPHLVLMDITLPFYNGYHWCSEIQAVLRRTYDLAGKIPVLEHRGAILNLYDTSLTYEGKKIDLTKNEFRILQTLMENKGRLVSRDTLMTKLWETDNYIEENTLTVNIARLRKKLEKAGLTDFITTKVGEGYIITQDAEGR